MGGTYSSVSNILHLYLRAESPPSIYPINLYHSNHPSPGTMQLPISSSIALLSLCSSITAYAYPSIYSDEYDLAERDAYPSMNFDEHNLAERDADASIYSDEYGLEERDAYPRMYSDEFILAERDADPSMFSDEYNLAKRDAFAEPEPYQTRFYERSFDEDTLYERDLALLQERHRQQMEALKIRSELVERIPKKCYTCKGQLGCPVGKHVVYNKNGKAAGTAAGGCPAPEAAPEAAPVAAPAAAPVAP
ncbi:hypothetical protein MMC15_007136 [Xylographa vitiligo]|nr:hypothetical protein [Xylographa vitiligo]